MKVEDARSDCQGEDFRFAGNHKRVWPQVANSRPIFAR